MGLKADLMIALTRVKIPLQKANDFKVGDMIDLNLSSMAQALVIDANGRAVARGTLGQIDGFRAVQIEQNKDRQHTEPRRRASDRDALDLPNVMAPQGDPSANDEGEGANLPSLSKIDVFGDLDGLPDLPDLPDMDEAAAAADSQIEDWNAAQDQPPDEEYEDSQREKQSGW